MAGRRAVTVPRARRRRPVRELRRVVGGTFSICLRHRVTGLAAEIGFFAILSLPPLVLGLVGTLGYFADVIGPETVNEVRARIIELAYKALSDQAVSETIIPTLDDVLSGARIDIVSLGFLLALWSGSRALNTTIDTIAIMYGLGGHRGIIATRALSFSLYIVGLVVGIVLAPLVLAGPSLVAQALPEGLSWVMGLYWPVVSVLTVASLATLFWIAVPVPNSWLRCMAGAALALGGWVAGSYAVRAIIEWSVGSTSIYGPLAASIVVLIWLYVLAIMVLIGAAFNAAIDRRWPQRSDDVTLDGIPVIIEPLAEDRPEQVAAAKSGDSATVVPLPFAGPEPAAKPAADRGPAPTADGSFAPERPAGHTAAAHPAVGKEVKRHGRR